MYKRQELYRITFSNRGGEVRSWILKNYKDNAGQPLDLVHVGGSTLFGYPLSLYTYDAVSYTHLGCIHNLLPEMNTMIPQLSARR